MLERVADFFVRPDKFFEDEAESAGESTSAGFIAPYLIIVGLMVVYLAHHVWFGHLFALETVPTRTLADQLRDVSQEFWMVAILAPIVMWVLFSAIFVGLSYVLGGSKDNLTTFKLVGWGFVPSLVFWTLSIVLLAIFTVISEGPGDAYSSYQGFTRSNIVSFPWMSLRLFSAGLDVNELLRVLFAVWQGVLWTYALKHAQGLSIRKAAGTAAIPVLMIVVWQIYRRDPTVVVGAIF